MSKPEPITDFQTDRAGVAHVLGVSVHRVHKLVAQGMPREAYGRYDIARCVQWRIQQLEAAGALDPDELPAVVAMRTKLYEQQERRLRLENDHTEGRTLHVDEVQEHHAGAAAVLVQDLDNLAARIAHDLTRTTEPSQRYDVIDRHCTEVRRQLTEYFEALADALQKARATTDAAAAP